MSPQRRQVVITGLGPITALGLGMEPLWSAMCEGRSGVKRISRFDPSGFPCQAGADIPDDMFDIKTLVPKSYRKATKVMARDIELAVAAASSAVADAGLVTKAVNPDVPPTIPAGRFGCHIGAGLIAADVDELSAALVTSRNAEGEFDLTHWGHTGMTNLTPLWLLKYLPNMLACHVTIIHDCQGPSNTITCAEASAILSVGESLRVIQRGAADACLSGGAEAKINPMGLLRQVFSGRLAKVNGTGDPSAVVKPFDPRAAGTVLGDGGGILVLEAIDTAKARGAKVYAEVAGFAATQSFCPDTVGLEVDAEGQAMGDAIESALEAAHISANDIDAITPFASGIPKIDQSESAALRRVFGERTAGIPLITVIPNVGNCCAGASAIPLVVAAKAVHEQKLPARINTTSAQGLDANAAPSRAASLRNVLVTTCGMGGQCAAIVLKRV